jgi:hypothetical protein
MLQRGKRENGWLHLYGAPQKVTILLWITEYLRAAQMKNPPDEAGSNQALQKPRSAFT